MKKIFFLFISLLSSGMALAQNVGVGTSAPAAKLDIIGTAANPSIPGPTSTGIIRIGVSSNEAIDIGKMLVSPWASWIQSGFGGTTADPISIQPLGGNVGIGTTSPKASAALDISSTTQGFLPPRMTFAQRNSIPSPAIGLVIWCTDCDELQVFNGTIWKSLGGRNACPPSPPYVTICDQDWMVKNLDVSTYRNGDPIPKVTDPSVWVSLVTGAYCYYANDSASYASTYGKLYNWYAVVDPRGLAPVGWHVPTDGEWTILADCLGGVSVAGGKMKETGTTNWLNPNGEATNSSGFTGLPGGYRYDIDGSFIYLHHNGVWWSCTEYNSTNARDRDLRYDLGPLTSFQDSKRLGGSVRCVRD